MAKSYEKGASSALSSFIATKNNLADNVEIESDIDKLYNQQIEFTDASFEYILFAEWQESIKNFVDWFLIKYRKLIAKRCHVAVQKLHLPLDTVDDLQSECYIQAYAIAQRYDPAKGDIIKFLLRSLWRHAMRSDYYQRYKANFSIDAVDSNTREGKKFFESVEYTENHSANDAHKRVYSLVNLLEAHERVLLNCKLILGMNNCQIASYIGMAEATVRYRLQKAMDKLKVSDEMLEQL